MPQPEELILYLKRNNKNTIDNKNNGQFIEIIDLDRLYADSKFSSRPFQARKKWKQIFWLTVFVNSMQKKLITSVHFPNLKYIDDDNNNDEEKHYFTAQSSPVTIHVSESSLFKLNCKTTSRLRREQATTNSRQRIHTTASCNSKKHKSDSSATPTLRPIENCRKTMALNFNTNKDSTEIVHAVDSSSTSSAFKVLSPSASAHFHYNNLSEVNFNTDTEKKKPTRFSRRDRQSLINQVYMNNDEGSIFAYNNYLFSPNNESAENSSLHIKTPRLRLYSINLNSTNAEDTNGNKLGADGSVMLKDSYKNRNYYYIKKSELRSLEISNDLYTPYLVANLNKQQLNMRKLSTSGESPVNKNNSILAASLVYNNGDFNQLGATPMFVDNTSFTTIPAIDQLEDMFMLRQNDLHRNDSSDVSQEDNLYELNGFHEFKVEAPSQTCMQNLLCILKSFASSICVIVLPSSGGSSSSSSSSKNKLENKQKRD